MTVLPTVQVGRLILGSPVGVPLSEGVGDPVTNVGGAVVPGSRTPPAFQIALATYLNPNQSAAQGQLYRRALRSLLGNTPLKLQGFLYVVYSDDTEQNGWYVPDASTLAGLDKASWKANGLWQTGQGNWLLAGRRRSHREAREVWMKDLRTGLYARDAQGLIYSTDFSALPSLQLSVLPNGCSNPVVSVSGQVLAGVALPTGRDGGVCQLVSGQADQTVISYERAETAMNLSDVIVYDRRGQITAPTTGPGTLWEEVYGTDFPWNWLTAGQAADTPVLDNGLVRVRYDNVAGNPNFRVDVWTGSAYVEQGAMAVRRVGDSSNYCDTWLSASLIEWTPDRAVLKAVFSASADSYSREQIYVTIQRGEMGVTFEVYPALTSTGAQADVNLVWLPAANAGVADLNNSVAKIDSQGSGSWTPGAAGAAVLAATAGTGAGSGNSGEFPNAFTTLGNSNFSTSENWVAILRYPTSYNVLAAYQATLVVQQAANALVQYHGSVSLTGFLDNGYYVESQHAAGYVQAGVYFSATQPQQVLEAESLTILAGSSITADASASGGSAVTATRTADANHVQKAGWLNSYAATYRVFVRAKVTAGVTGSFYAQIGSVGATVTTTSTSYLWLDLGEFTTISAGQSLNIHAWLSAAGTVSVDRIEAVLVQDRTRTGAVYSGSRDLGQAALQDSRTLGRLVARA